MGELREKKCWPSNFSRQNQMTKIVLIGIGWIIIHPELGFDLGICIRVLPLFKSSETRLKLGNLLGQFGLVTWMSLDSVKKSKLGITI